VSILNSVGDPDPFSGSEIKSFSGSKQFLDHGFVLPFLPL
jgi:hypothetical protein